MNECNQGHTGQCMAFNQLTGKFYCEDTSSRIQELESRLSIMTELAKKLLKRMELINGSDKKCCMNPESCANHSLIHEAKKALDEKM